MTEAAVQGLGEAVPPNKQDSADQSSVRVVLPVVYRPFHAWRVGPQKVTVVLTRCALSGVVAWYGVSSQGGLQHSCPGLAPTISRSGPPETALDSDCWWGTATAVQVCCADAPHIVEVPLPKSRRGRPRLGWPGLDAWEDA